MAQLDFFSETINLFQVKADLVDQRSKKIIFAKEKIML